MAEAKRTLAEALQARKERERRPAPSRALPELRGICAEEGYSLEVAERRNRDGLLNPFA